MWGNTWRYGPIGVFDSGYGGLTVLKSLCQELPEYDYLYLGDNARAPYGTRSYDVVYRFTLDAVRQLFDMGCPLVILACNTASAKALRTIQQNDLVRITPYGRVLGVIRPTAETLGTATRNGHVGVVGTPGTVSSMSYNMEIAKLWPEVKLTTHACPMWVPLVENREADSDGADYFVKKDIDAILAKDPQIDTLVLACTHYPLLAEKIRKYLPGHISLVCQGQIVADSLKDYLARHPEIESRISRNGSIKYKTTENPEKFASLAELFLGRPVLVDHIEI